jgi:hypothetical protein
LSRQWQRPGRGSNSGNGSAHRRVSQKYIADARLVLVIFPSLGSLAMDAAWHRDMLRETSLWVAVAAAVATAAVCLGADTEAPSPRWPQQRAVVAVI